MNREQQSKRHLLIGLLTLCVLSGRADASLFQHLDASVSGSFFNNGGTLTWLDQSGNGRHAVDTSAGSGSVSLSTDPTVFPTGLDSLRFDGADFANFGRLNLFGAAESDAVLDQSGPNPDGFTVLVVARGDTNPVTGGWNDLIGNTTDVLDGAFLMRYNYDNGRFQGAVGTKTFQNNLSGQANYNQGAATVMGFSYDPSQSASEVTLVSSWNDYTQSFDLSSAITDRDFSNNDPFTLGKAFDTVGRLFVGNVGEVKVYDAALTQGELASEIDALNQKWNKGPDGRLDLIVDRATGNATLNSPGSVDIDLVGLRLRSPSGSLDTSDWLSITDNYDADSGASQLDADDTWLKLSEKAHDVSEATFGTSTVTAGQSLDLGSLLVLGAAEDIVAEYADPETQDTLPVVVRYVNQTPANLEPGDFDDDGSVDLPDLMEWQRSFGDSVALPNETVSLGRVTTEDLATWSANASGSGANAGIVAVPETSGAMLAAFAAAALVTLDWLRRARFPFNPRMTCACALMAFVAGVLSTTAIEEASATEATVGVYYYPWWDTHDWDETLRARMLPEDQRPEAGYTNSSDFDLITDHINQSHRGNISLWSHSWWGPGSTEDNVLRQNILPHPRAGEIKHAVHYESTGRFGRSNNNPNFNNLVPDFEYLAENVFTDPNYYRIDGRPVVFMYVSRAYFNNPAAQQALANARQSLVQNYGYDPYVVGDEVFDSSFNASRASHFDAVTTYDVYAMSGMKFNGATQGDVATAASKYAQAAAAGATVIPGISPGYNDKIVRDGNPATGRYFENETVAQAGSVFSTLLDQAAAPNLDPAVNNLLMVNSFNEWHEDTQIEPTIVTPPSGLDDSATGFVYTQGKAYEGYGNKYLDILRAGTTEGPLLLDGDADFDGDLDNDDITAFAAAWGEENLVDGVVVGGYESRISMPDFNYDGVVDFGDWFVMREVHPTAGSVNLASLLTVPEPSAALLGALGGAGCFAMRIRRPAAWRGSVCLFSKRGSS